MPVWVRSLATRAAAGVPIDQCTDLRGWLRAGSQQRLHGLGADAVVPVVDGCFPQGGPERGEHPPNLPARSPRAVTAQRRTSRSASFNGDKRLGTAASCGEAPARAARACGRSKGLSWLRATS